MLPLTPKVALVAALLASLALAVPLSSSESSYIVKEEILPPHGWIKHSKPSPDHTITLRIGLPQPNFHVLEKHLYEVSDPEHERYGQHLSKQDVEALVSPHPESLDAVNEWLSTFGFRDAELDRSPANDWVIITVPVKMAEEMLDTTYHVWKHTASGDSLVRATSYSLPTHLHGHIDVIQPTTMFGRMAKQKSTVFATESADDSPIPQAKVVNPAGPIDVKLCNIYSITISCLQQLYNAVGYVPDSSLSNSIGITGYLDEYANLQDLQKFYAEQRPDALNSSFNFISLDGGKNDQNISKAGSEANLDVQFAFGLSYPINSTFWSTGGSPPFNADVKTRTNNNEPYQVWLDYILGQENIPLAISTSYCDDEQTVPESYAKRVCAGFAQLGARGVSMMFASGDYGVGDGNPDPATQQCLTNDGKNSTKFIPVFPASCPYVTSVGGTVQFAPEVAVSRYYSGGGFSNYFSRPSYQESAVDKYLGALPEGLYKGLYNPQGRGFPDVSAQSDFFRIWHKGKHLYIGGTSASSPAFTAIVALLNDARLKANMTSLGFLNPLLYSKGASGLTDILSGKNPGCGTQGFNVTEGWDPVTGLGTPDFGKLKEIVTSP